MYVLLRTMINECLYANFAVAFFNRDSVKTSTHDENACDMKDSTIAALQARLEKVEKDLEAATADTEKLTADNQKLTAANQNLTDENTRLSADNLKKRGELADQTDNLWDSLELLMLAYIKDRYGDVRMTEADVISLQGWLGTEEFVLIAKRVSGEREVVFIADAIGSNKKTLWDKNFEQCEIVNRGDDSFLCLEKGPFRPEPHVKVWEVEFLINLEASFPGLYGGEQYERPIDLQDLGDWLLHYW